MSVVVVGSANLDTVYRLEGIPAPGQTVLSAETVSMPGGKGNNQAVAAARAGADVSFVVALGADAAGDVIAAAAADAGIRLQARRVEAATGSAVIMVDPEGENAIVVDSGANRLLTDLHPRELAVIDEAEVLLLQLETPLTAVVAAAERGRASGAIVILNAAPARSLDAGLLRLVDVLVVNEREAESIAASIHGPFRGDVTDEDLATALSALGLAVIVTLGARGALVAVPGEPPAHVPGIRVHAVDTTGAGDTFCGALAAFLDGAEGSPDLGALISAAEFATAAAALSVQRAGAVPSIPTRDEIEALRASA